MRRATVDGIGREPTGAAPTFSVLLATYNHARYVAEALNAVAAQTFADYELVVVNDGSTDDTESVVTRWLEGFRTSRTNRAVLSTIPNSGQSAAFEHGLGLCTGSYVALLDSDDRWLADKLERIFEALTADPEAGMIVHPLYVIDPEGCRTGDLRPKRARLSEGDLRAQIRRTGRHVAPVTSGVVIRADVFRRLVPMPTKGFTFAADGYLTFGASLLAPVRALPRPLAEYRMHPGGQYLRRMLAPEGPGQSVEMHLAIARHFGLQGVMERNSWFARNAFAAAKFEAGFGRQAAAYLRLARATATDPAFRPAERAMLLAYWTLCLASPVRLFGALWRAFQLRHTGYDKVERGRPEAVR